MCLYAGSGSAVTEMETDDKSKVLSHSSVFLISNLNLAQKSNRLRWHLSYSRA